DVRPNEPHPRRFAIVHFVTVEGTDAVLEAAFDWWIERTGRIVSVEPPNRPLVCLRILCAQCDGAISTIGRVERVFFHVGLAIHELAIAARAVEIYPLLTVRFHAMMMHAPFADEKIEIVQPCVRARRCLTRLHVTN